MLYKDKIALVAKITGLTSTVIGNNLSQNCCFFQKILRYNLFQQICIRNLILWMLKRYFISLHNFMSLHNFIPTFDFVTLRTILTLTFKIDTLACH